MDMAELAAGDRFLLCSDGLDKHVQPGEIADILANGPAEASARRLIDLTLDRGATDNVTVIVVQVDGAG
jgi:serine/threonine protein phosphatase PrpC